MCSAIRCLWASKRSWYCEDARARRGSAGSNQEAGSKYRSVASHLILLEKLMRKISKCQIHALAAGAGACGCGAGAHFLAHPCIGHAILAIVAWGLGIWAYFRAN